VSSNKLHLEKSPYLFQHKENPVWWQPWGDEAFKEAKKQDKLIFLSIGYSSCHWCHVMAHETFEDNQVADLLNKDFISIKLDREERPDVDSLYMRAVQIMTGQGGWPLTMFLTPDKKPIFGGTYFPRQNFIGLISQLANGWQTDREKILEFGAQLHQIISESSKNGEENNFEINEASFSSYVKEALSAFDSEFGGFGSAPKFPPSMSLNLLLRIYKRTEDKKILQIIEKTLQAMAAGGIYDHVGGGFSRYSTDQKWLIPHFEKMLYDNALLAKVYFEAYQVTQSPKYKEIGSEILRFLIREMQNEEQGKEGGFYSALDADTEGEEGKFYAWTIEELKTTLEDSDFEKLCELYNIPVQGNFEHGKIVISLKEFQPGILKTTQQQNILSILYNARAKRTLPFRDQKIISEWNGLAIEAFALGFEVSNEHEFLSAATRAATFFEDRLWKDNEIIRRYCDGEARFNGVLNDYAYIISGLLGLYRATFKPHYLDLATLIQKKQDSLFWSKQSGAYLTSNDQETLPRAEFFDEAIPNANGISALNLQKLYTLTLNLEFKEKAKSILERSLVYIKKYPMGVATILSALDMWTDTTRHLVIEEGSNDQTADRQFLPEFHKIFCPNLVISSKKSNAVETTYSLCDELGCRSPTKDTEKIFSEISRSKNLNLDI